MYLNEPEAFLKNISRFYWDQEIIYLTEQKKDRSTQKSFLNDGENWKHSFYSILSRS